MKVVLLISLVLFWVAFVQAKSQHGHHANEKQTPELLNFEKLKTANVLLKSTSNTTEEKPSVLVRASKKQEPKPVEKVLPVTIQASDGRPALTEFHSNSRRTKINRRPNEKLQALANRTASVTVTDRYGSSYTDINDFTATPYVVAIYSPSDDYFSGGGVAINTRWLVTTADIGDEVKYDYGYEYFVYQTIADPDTLPTTSEKNRKIEEIIIHDDYYTDEWTYDIAIMKVCPPFVMTFFAILPQPDTVSYTYNTPMSTFIYYDGGHFAGTTQWFSYDSICEYDMGNHYDASTHFCIDGWDSSNDIDIEDIWYCAIVVDWRGRVIGFGTEEGQDRWSLSAALMMENYYDWITTRTS